MRGGSRRSRWKRSSTPAPCFSQKTPTPKACSTGCSTTTNCSPPGAPSPARTTTSRSRASISTTTSTCRPPPPASRSARSDARVAVVYAAGTIVSGPSGPDILGSDGFAEALRDAREDESVAAVVIRVDSPGGSAAASDVMWGEVQATAELMPVVVSMGGVAASGGYYLAAAADTVVADPMTITGSIGVISLLFDASGLLTDKLGLTFDEVKTGPYADLVDVTNPVTPAERALLQEQTDRIYDLFVRRVADGRGLSPDSVRALGGGRVYTGARAQEVGLVDVLGGLDRAVAVAAEMAGLETGDYQTLRLPRERPFAERLMDDLGAGLRLRAARWTAADALASTPLRSEVATLREAARLHAKPQARLWWNLD